MISSVAVSGVVAPAQAANTVNVGSTPLKFVYSATDTFTGVANPDGKTNGDKVIYRNVATVDGIRIDAVVTTTLNGAAIGDYDNTGSASNSNAIAGTVASENFQVDMTTSAVNGTTSFSFEFFEGNTYTVPGSGDKVVLKNVKVTSIDLDGSGMSGNHPGDFQYTDLTGFQSYTLSNPSSLVVSNPSAGVVRFKATDDTNGGNRPADRVQVSYDTVEKFTAIFGNVLSGKLGYFGLLFVVDAWNGCGCTTTNTTNTYNSPPVSTDVTKYVGTATPTQISLANFGSYSDPDYNPFTQVQIQTLPSTGTLEYFDGTSWVAVTANQVISTTDLNLGKLRFTGSSSTSFTFKVYDGLAYSVAANTLTLTMSPTSQTITFNNPGTKTPSQTFAAGGTASSGLTVTYVSLTPGVCTVSGGNITTVASGLCTIVASQPGNSTYGAANDVTQSFVVTSLTPQSINFTNPGNQAYGGSNINLASGATATSNLTVTLVSFTPSVCTISGLTIVIVGPGICNVKATQPGNGTYAPAAPVEWTFTVSSGAGTTTTAVPTTTAAPTTTVAPTTTIAGSTTTVAVSASTTTVPGLPVCVTPVITIATGVMPNGYVGEAYSWAPTVSGGTLLWTVSSGALPNGLSLNSSTGAITGTPMAVATATVEITATPISCAGSVAAGRITVTIVILPPGRVSGVIWIDINKNGKQDSKEPVLPGITVTLGSSVSSASVRTHALSTVSGADGSYLIRGVDVGSYTVTAKLSTEVGLAKSWDSNGTADWKVPVAVLSQKEAIADFAAVGKTSLTGSVVSNNSSINPAGAKVACTWAGIDGIAGTADDVVFSTTANSSGTYTLPSTPSGSFSCIATDAQTGKATSGSKVSVAKGTIGVVKLAHLRFGGLPATGGSPMSSLQLSMLMFAIGLAMLWASRRRAGTH